MRAKTRVTWLFLPFCCFPAIVYYVYLYHFVTTDSISIKLPVASAVYDARVLEHRIQLIEQELIENRLLTQTIRKQISDYVNQLKPNQVNKPISLLKCKVNNLTNGNKNADKTTEEIYNEIEFDNPNGGVWTQGWPININQSRFTATNPLQVIVVPHSHNDPGWLKTFEQYFETQTKWILNNMLSQMTKSKQTSFIWAEVSFFARWYESLKSEDAKESIKLLLENGQLEFVTGGWVMNDEANTNYFGIIAQLVEGHEWLVHNLNYRPKNGWAIDPFGLSSSMAFLLKQMGFQSMVVQRVHYALKKYLAKQHLLEFNWRQPWEQVDKSGFNDILCHVMPFYSYDVPHTCGPDPKVCCQFDFKRLANARMSCPWKVQPQTITDDNVQVQAELLLDQYKKKAMLFQTNALLVPLGDDFRFDKALEWIKQFENYQNLFDFINSKPSYNTNIKFGTLNDYFDLVLQSKTAFKSLTGDFFTYADRDDNYWSGYYTSRPFYKRYDRVLESYLRAAELLFSAYSISNGGKSNLLQILSPKLTKSRQSLALFQHHDGITGTAKTFVVQDYANKMFEAIVDCQHVIASITNSLLYLPMQYPFLSVNFTREYFVDKPDQQLTLALNSNSNKWSLLVYNSLAHERFEIICFQLKIPIENQNWILRDDHGKLIVDVQITNNSNDSKEFEQEVCFSTSLLPFSITQFTIELSNFDPHYEQSKITVLTDFNDNHIQPNDEFSIQNDCLTLTFGRTDGLLRHVTRSDDKHHMEKFKLRFDFGTFGTRKGKRLDHSGAYLFLPDADEPSELKYDRVKVKIVEGSLVSRVHIDFDGPIPIEHVLTIAKGQSYIDVRNTFTLGKRLLKSHELVMRLYSDIQNHGVFFTDLNAFQIARRQYLEKIPLQGNVYPMPTMAYLQDQRARLTVLTGQALGVTSHFSGNLDVFLDRYLLHDDQRGLGQGVIDNLKTQEFFRILIEPSSKDNDKPTLDAQTQSLNLLHPPLVMRGNQQSNQGQIRFLRNELPCNIHLLNFRTNLYASNEFSVFFHRFACTCETDCEQSSFNLNDLFSSMLSDLLDQKATRRSLSLMHSKGDWNFTSNRVQLDPGHFEVITLQLKN